MVSHVLVPMDHSEAAERALEFALSTFPDARISVIHVTNPVEDSYFATEEDFYSHVQVLEEDARERAERIFEEATAAADRHGTSIDTETVIGQPTQAIVEYVTNEGIDHVVIGSHGRGGVARLFLGSVAETVVRKSPVPVTVIKAPSEERAE